MKIKYPLLSQLNFYCKLISLLIALIFINQGELFAMQLSGLYLSACEREIGIILNVDDTNVKILSLDGNIKKVKRFDIIYIAQYPVGKVYIPKIEPFENIRITEIKTLYNNKVTDLLKGWMIDYSKKNISFLTTSGVETVIDINDIWDISLLNQNKTIFFKKNGEPEKFNFVHPYPFISCSKDKSNSGLNIYPHHLLEDPLLIKTELDRLQLGYEELKSYVKEKVFYPKPQLFENLTTLGLWASYNLRYGASSTRNSSFLPVLRAELSEGLFKFQRVMITGVAPMPYSIHEEPQSQYYYGMKSGYFHMSFMFDLNMILLGNSKYKWLKDDLNNLDDRQNEVFHLSGGFDYRNYSFEFTIGEINYGLRNGDLFYSNSTSISRFGLFYNHRLLKIALYIGTGSGDKTDNVIVPSENASDEEKAYFEQLNEEERLKNEYDLFLNYYRLNIDFLSLKSFRRKYSIIYKSIQFDKYPGGTTTFKYEGSSLINSLYFNYDLKEEDLFFSWFISVEMTSKKSGETEFTEESQETYFKCGASIGLVF